MKKQTFILEIDGARDHSWQGQLRWIQGDDKQSFRSVIELLRLIDSAINEENSSLSREYSSGPGNQADPWEGASAGDSPGASVPPG